jgi:GTP cyclohydrolase II
LGIESPKEGAVALELGEGSAAQEIRDIADPGAVVSFRLPPIRSGVPKNEKTCLDAAVRLIKLARLLPAAVAAVVPGKPDQLLEFSQIHDLPTLTAEHISAYDLLAARSLKAVSQARVPLDGAENARIVAYRPADGGIEHLAIIIGTPKGDAPVLARLHSECFTGDLLGSLRCDCGDQLRGAIEEISNAGAGVLIYLAQEGRGIGLVNKLRAYSLQDQGLDTLDANQQLGFDADERIYLPAARILRDLGFERVRLMTNNPDKVAALTHCGIEVTERVSHVFPANVHNETYLETKRSRGGHLF